MPARGSLPKRERWEEHAGHWRDAPSGTPKQEHEVASKETNIGIARSLYAAFGARNIPGILELLSHDVEWGEPENPFNPAGGTRHGHAGFLEWVDIGKNAEEIVILEPRKMLTDADTVGVVGFMKCRVLQTGKIYESDFVHVITIEGGKVTKFQEFFDTFVAGEAFRE
jgi:ketosteroid isomerase-like protein